jgi:hypothetical protein
MVGKLIAIGSLALMVCSAQADDSHREYPRLKGVTAMSYDANIGYELGDQCKDKDAENTLRQELDYFATQNARPELVSQGQQRVKARELEDDPDLKPGGLFDKDFDAYKAKSDKVTAYALMPTINIFVQVTDGLGICIADVKIAVNAQTRVWGTGSIKIIATGREIGPPYAELRSEAYTIRASKPLLTQAISKSVVKIVKDLVVDWSQAQNLPY